MVNSQSVAFPELYSFEVNHSSVQSCKVKRNGILYVTLRISRKHFLHAK